MPSRLTKEKIAIGFYLIIGSIGAIGQAFLIRYKLVDSYPIHNSYYYADLYERIGNIGVFIAPAAAIVLAYILVSEKRFWTAAIPVFVCPLVFLLLFDYFTWTNPTYGNDVEKRFVDFNSVIVNHEIISFIFQLTKLGVIIGLTLGGVIFLVEKILYGFVFKSNLK